VTSTITTVYVHAHPDDESLFTGLRTVLEARAGSRQVLVTMTDGSLGIDPDGRTADDPRHDRAATARVRSHELHDAAALLGFDRVVELGFRDSGMAGWASAAEPGSFACQDRAIIAAQVAEILRAEGPCSVVTYDHTGFYGHPDHVATAHAAMAAAALVDTVRSVEAVVMTEGDVDHAVTRAREVGELLPEWLGERLITLTPEEEVTRVLDAPQLASIKQAALAAHRSQIDNQVLIDLDPELFAGVFGHERYVTLLETDGVPPSS
jgi:LmbE family N-acetylglucosaminyl deacetylase